jgi:hypothetical protein
MGSMPRFLVSADTWMARLLAVACVGLMLGACTKCDVPTWPPAQLAGAPASATCTLASGITVAGPSGVCHTAWQTTQAAQSSVKAFCPAPGGMAPDIFGGSGRTVREATRCAERIT